MKENIFEDAPVSKAYLTMALPVVFSMVITLVYNLVDTLFISMTGNTLLIAGVSLCAPLFNLFLALGDVFGIGGSSLLSRLFGAKENKKAKKAGTLCVYSSVLVGILCAASFFVLKDSILRMLGADNDTLPYASRYFSVIALGAPLIIFSLVPSNLLRTEGFAKASMFGSVLGAVVNMILDPVFIFALGLQEAGAAMATLIGYIFTDIFYFWWIHKKSQAISLSARDFSWNASILKNILSVGLPASITNLTGCVGVALLNQNLAAYGANTIAAMGIVAKINMIVVLILVGLAFGGQPLIGYVYGAKMMERLKKVLKFGFGLQLGMAAGMSAVILLLARQLVGLFLQDPVLQDMAVHMLTVYQCGMIGTGLIMIITCLFQATGKGFSVLLLSMNRQGVLYAIILFAARAWFGQEGIIAAQPVCDWITALLALTLFFIWKNKELRPEPQSRLSAQTE